jgi:lambda family phage portal protein
MGAWANILPARFRRRPGGGVGPRASVDDARGHYSESVFESPYRVASHDRQDTVEWNPAFGSADGALLPARDLAVARVRDVVRNDPVARSAVERLMDAAVGEGLRLSARPDFEALGITDGETRRVLKRALQWEWRAFCDDPRRTCDSQRRLSMNGLLRLFARTWFTVGETAAALGWKPGEQRYATCVLAIDPDRVSNPYGTIDRLTMRGGVEMTDDGEPRGYHVRNAHAGDWWAYGRAWTWTYVPRRTEWGRPVFIHGFEPDREGMSKAMTPFASLINRLRMIGKFADNELAAATANALFAAFVETEAPADEVAERLTPQRDIHDRRSWMSYLLRWYEKFPAKIGGVRIPVLAPGSKVTMNASPRQTTAFPAFQTAFLHSIAASLNLSYEQLTMDWSRVNYSSARAALNEVWRSLTRMRAAFAEQVVAPIYYAVIEEAFDRGYIEAPVGAPDFWDNPGAYLAARWIGPGRGVVDPLKEAEASTMRIENLTSTYEDECAERGKDYIEVFDQIALERKELSERGLSRESLVMATRSTRGPKPDSEEVEEKTGAEMAAHAQALGDLMAA